MTDFNPLFAALGNAEVGTEALDRQVAAACEVQWSPDEGGQFGGYNILPARCHFTRSLDAALTLVPAGCFWRVGHDGEGPDPSLFKAQVLVADRPGCPTGISEAPALALCIAALRARIASKPAGPERKD